jgi:hypothetical protein
MKTKHVIVTAILLIAGGFSMQATAQEALNALVRKCETLDSVDTNIVRSRDKETKQLNRSITDLTIRNNEALVNEFTAAFKKEEENATQAIENKQGGKTVSFFYRFDNVDFSFSIQDKGNATVSVIENKGETKAEPAKLKRNN